MDWIQRQKKLPKGCRPILYFDYEGTWYQIVEGNDKYIIFREEADGSFKQIGTGSHYHKLEIKVREGKLKC